MTIWDGLARTLRPIAESSLPDRAAAERRTRVRQPGGQITESWQSVLTDEPCRLMPEALPQVEIAAADQPTAPNRYVVSFLMSTPITADMRLTITGTDLDGASWTRVLQVIAVDGPKTYEVLRNVTCIDPAQSGR